MNIVSTKEGYDQWSKYYDSEHNPLIYLETPIVHEFLGDLTELSVIDLGCGTGRHTQWIASAGAKTTAVDQSNGMIGVAQKKVINGEINFVNHDLHEPFPFKDNSFDRVCSFLVLDHIEDLGFFFKEAHRICKPNGFILISSMHPAMNLIGVQARFKDPETEIKIAPQSFYHVVSDYVTAALKANLSIGHISEHKCTEETALKCSKDLKYVNWPLLLMMKLFPSKS